MTMTPSPITIIGSALFYLIIIYFLLMVMSKFSHNKV